MTQQAPGTCFSYTYCIALLIGDRVELSAIVERGVNPTPLVCRLPEWPETAGRMQGEQQQSREQRREEEKIKGENKRVGNSTVRTALCPEERLGSVLGLHAGTYLLPATSSWHCTLRQGGGHNLPHRRTDVRALRVPGNSQLPATASTRRNQETWEATYQGAVMELFIPATHSQLPTPLPEPLLCYKLAPRRAFYSRT